MKQQRYIPEASRFQQASDCGMRTGCLSSMQRRRLRARLNSVLALYPSTTTELPFT